MTVELPEAIECAHLADDAATLRGRVDRQRLSRVTGVYRVVGDAEARLEFRRDGEGRVVIEGEVQALLEARCQRCLEWMPFRLDASVAVTAVADEAAAASCQDDVVVAPAGRLALLELIEDEILLACPMIPVHDTPACTPVDPEGMARNEDRHRPFAGLGELLNKRG